MSVIELDEAEASAEADLVGPVIRSGDLAEAVIDAVAKDNPDQDVIVVDRDDYIRIHTRGSCRLTLASLEEALGRPYQLEALEIDMPSFKGRLKTRTNEFTWFLQGSMAEA
ncbi:MmoB/DmpM family protein [Nocardioides sp. WS12]|uniref:MmoB/DmpM family protein n=1 Tax=Nocardioides sp. WS12 TaxID=2486272 RepID=UPI0015FE132E|nr:MmoB/DmpM family protein [Nocardioides sp. WS12]